MRRTRGLAPLLLVLALSLPWTRAALEGNAIWQEKAYHRHGGDRHGVLGALWLGRWPQPAPRVCHALRWGGALGLLAATLGGHWLWPLLHQGVMLLLTGSALALLVALRSAPSRVPRALRWLCSWGRLSYEIYLSYMFVVFVIMQLVPLKRRRPAQRLPLVPAGVRAVLGIGLARCTLAVAPLRALAAPPLVARGARRDGNSLPARLKRAGRRRSS